MQNLDNPNMNLTRIFAYRFWVFRYGVYKFWVFRYVVVFGSTRFRSICFGLDTRETQTWLECQLYNKLDLVVIFQNSNQKNKNMECFQKQKRGKKRKRKKRTTLPPMYNMQFIPSIRATSREWPGYDSMRTLAWRPPVSPPWQISRQLGLDGTKQEQKLTKNQ